MKNLLSLFTLLAFFATATFAQNTTIEADPNAGGPTMNFETVKVNYGTIEQNSDPYREFKFTNEGTEPLIIKNAKGSCGCTVPSYPKEPIMPGESNVIKVRYDTKRIGNFTKTVRLTTNEGDTPHVLTITGKVLAAPTPESTPAKTAPGLGGK